MDHVNDEAASIGSHGIRIIDPDMYKAAVEANIEYFEKNNNHPLEVLATPIKNTILHICLASPNKTQKLKEFVEQILRICPSLLMQFNDRGDTPLHLAAKFGHLGVVKVLIKFAKDHSEDLESDLGAAATNQRMLRKKNDFGNTALHEAVKNNYPRVVKLLTKEDPHYSYSANDSGESPLFIATEVGSLRMVKIILEICQSVSHEGPDGKTALHVAVLSKNLEITRTIVEKKNGLTKATDNNGWTPLHWAAYYDCFSIVQYLLERDGCVAFVADKERKMTPLHMAAGQGYVKIMEKIISCRPDCCEMVDVRRWNFLHFASAAALYPYRLSIFAGRNSKFKNLTQDLLTAKDIEGNTPLHVYAVCQAPFLVRKLLFLMKVRGREHALNNENDSISQTNVHGSPKLQKQIDELKVVGKGPYRKGIIRSDNKRLLNSFNSRMQKGRDAQLVVAALVATVTFAAAFTMPGGFDEKEGTAILTKKTSFQVFIVSDAIAMMMSLLAVFLHLMVAINFDALCHMIIHATSLTIYSIGAMVIAFVTGTYAVLTPSLTLSSATASTGVTFFVLLVGMIALENWL